MIRPFFRVCSLLAGVLLSVPAYALFTQCPPIGLSAGCAFLITINPDGSLTFQSDPSIPPFDGVEDELIGILNRSGATVYGISLSGPGIFGFDGDGANSGNYAGPGTSFSLIDTNSGAVNFTNGLQDGGSLWFSLEGGPAQVKLSHTVTVDPGHGGPTVPQTCPKGRTGATGPLFGDQERNLALSIGLNLQTVLVNNGYTVFMTRTTANTCPSYQTRAAIANNNRTNIFVSIHLDGSTNVNAHGTNVKYDGSSSSQQLGSLILPQVSSKLGTLQGSVAFQSVSVLQLTNMAGVLVEAAFLSNNGDQIIMHNPNAPGLAAQGFFAGIDNFFNQ
jgi:N-acetylmuramoyl-L-alanine amidase